MFSAYIDVATGGRLIAKPNLAACSGINAGALTRTIRTGAPRRCRGLDAVAMGDLEVLCRKNTKREDWRVLQEANMHNLVRNEVRCLRLWLLGCLPREAPRVHQPWVGWHDIEILSQSI